MYSLSEIFTKLKDDFALEHCRLDNGLLLNVVESYFQDLKRVKDYHGISYANSYKKSAYTIKWICKIRPIQYDKDTSTSNMENLLANELFAIDAGISFLEVEIEKHISVPFLKDLLYFCHYRNISGRSFSMVMYLLEKTATKQKP